MATMVKPRVAAERAEGVAEILQEDVEPGKAAGFALLLSCLLDAAEANEGATAGFVGRHAVADVFFDGEIDVGLELGVEVGVALLACGRRTRMRLKASRRFPLEVSFGGHGEDAAHDHRETIPVGGVLRPLLAAGCG